MLQSSSVRCRSRHRGQRLRVRLSHGVPSARGSRPVSSPPRTPSAPFRSPACRPAQRQARHLRPARVRPAISVAIWSRPTPTRRHDQPRTTRAVSPTRSAGRSTRPRRGGDREPPVPPRRDPTLPMVFGSEGGEGRSCGHRITLSGRDADHPAQVAQSSPPSKRVERRDHEGRPQDHRKRREPRRIARTVAIPMASHSRTPRPAAGVRIRDDPERRLQPALVRRGRLQRHRPFRQHGGPHRAGPGVVPGNPDRRQHNGRARRRGGCHRCS